MKITVDSNILLSVFIQDSNFQRSVELLEKFAMNDFIISDCIYLELAVHFGNVEELDEVLDILEVELLHCPKTDHERTLNAWLRYLKKKTFVCSACHKTIHPICPECGTLQSFRQRILVDFIIGSFASCNGDGILTLDTTYYKNYFPKLKIFD